MRAVWSVPVRISVVLWCALISPPTLAQDTKGESLVLEEIVVTSRKREENLQDVPVSMQVVSGRARETGNINSLNALAELNPSIHVSGIAGGGRANEIFIRGFGSGNNQSFDQSVGMFIDDVYHGRSRISSGTFLDIQRVEILKGPQSTYFGNNATAGAYSIVTRKPGNELAISARALYGEFGQYAIEGAIGGPVTEDLGIRVAVGANGQEGWLENINTGQNAPNDHSQVGRMVVQYTPTDRLAMTLKLEASQRENEGSWSVQVENCPPSPPFTQDGFCDSRLMAGLPTGLDNKLISDSFGAGSELKTKNSTLRLDYEASGHVLTSLTAYHDYDYTANLDADFLPETLLHIQAPEDYQQFSQEFRISSTSESKFDYLFGAYFQTDELFFQQDFNYSFLNGLFNANPAFAPLVPHLPIGQSTGYQQDEDVYAIFGALTWRATDRLSITGELRGSWVEKAFEQRIVYGTSSQSYGGINETLSGDEQQLLSFLGVPANERGSRRDDDLLPSARIMYDVSESAMGYVSYTKGFKAGGFNGTDNTGLPENLPFEPESVDAFELGLKGQFLHDRLLLNLALYRMDYSDRQVTVSENTTGAVLSVVRNAAKQRSQGLEIESDLIVTPSLKISSAVSYLDAKYTSFADANPTLLQLFEGAQSQELTGERAYYSPQWSGTVVGVYNPAIFRAYNTTFEIAGIFSSSYFLTNVNDSLLEQDSYTRLDARVTVESPTGTWAVDFLGKNLTDRIVRTFAGTVPTTLGSTYLQKQPPRNFAVQIRYEF